MTCIQQSSELIQAYEQGLNSFAHIVSNTNSLEKFLRITYKVIKFYSETQYTTGKKIALGLVNLSLQLRNTIEILGAIQSVNLIKKLTCPNKEGLYFFYRVSWQKYTSNIFFLFYSIFSNIKLAAKLKFINLGKIGKVAIKHLPIFTLVTGTLYILSCSCTVGEAVRTQDWFKAATSVGKIFITALTLFLQALHIHRTFYILALTGVSAIIDTLCLAKNEDFL